MPSASTANTGISTWNPDAMVIGPRRLATSASTSRSRMTNRIPSPNWPAIDLRSASGAGASVFRISSVESWTNT